MAAIDFLTQFNNNLKALGEFKLTDLYNSIATSNLSLKSVENKLDKDSLVQSFGWISDFYKVINSIKNIINNPRMHLKLIKDLTIASNANKVDNDGFLDTVKDGRLWNVKGDKRSPHRVYNNFQEDDIAIYENKFVKILIDNMFEFVLKRIIFLSRRINSMSQIAGNIDINYDNIAHFNNLSLLDEDTDDTESMLITSSDPIADIYKKLFILKVKLNQLRSTSFYKECSRGKKINSENLKVTKMLLMVNEYNACYKLWVKIRSDKYSPDTDIADNKYYFSNYVSTKLLYNLLWKGYLIESGNDCVNFNCDKLHITDLVLKKNNLFCTINTLNSGDIDIKIELVNKNYIVDKEENLVSKLISRMIIKYEQDLNIDLLEPESATIELNKTINNLVNSQYDNCFIITPCENLINNSHIMTITSDNKVLDSNIDRIIQAMSIFIEGDSYIYSNKCPICGFKSINYDEINYNCLNCNSVWTVLTANKNNKNQDILWIKNLSEQPQYH